MADDTEDAITVQLTVLADHTEAHTATLQEWWHLQRLRLLAPREQTAVRLMVERISCRPRTYPRKGRTRG